MPYGFLPVRPYSTDDSICANPGGDAMAIFPVKSPGLEAQGGIPPRPSFITGKFIPNSNQVKWS